MYEPKEPGFYHCSVFLEKQAMKGKENIIFFGYEPEKIISSPDNKEDFLSFWQTTLEELKKVDPQFKLKRLTEYSGGKKNLYHVSMYSLGNVMIEGYYAVPKVKGKYPALIHYMGYGAEPYLPDINGNPEFAEFILSVRGQGIQKATNTYGDWILWGLNSKEDYYYRGAYMDVIRAIDFIASRPEVDAEKIAAEGGSQGGAFTFVACALDKRIKVCAPGVPFLSDFEDYFKVAKWPADAFRKYLNAHSEITWEHLYELLSYFDIKNFAPYITCPMFMAVGLKDDVCPPHINFAAYNQVHSSKQYYAFPYSGHSLPVEWYNMNMEFLKMKLGI